MITRFFSAFRRAILAVPGNPYAEINRLRRSNGFLSMRVSRLIADKKSLRSEAHYARTERNEATRCFTAMRDAWIALNDSLAAQLEASEQANEAFMVEREELKCMSNAHATLGLSFAQAAGEGEVAFQAVVEELAAHVEANEELAATVAELQAERDVTLPFLKAVEAKLGTVGVTVADEGGTPAVTVDAAKLSTAIRARVVTLASAQVAMPA